MTIDIDQFEIADLIAILNDSYSVVQIRDNNLIGMGGDIFTSHELR